MEEELRNTVEATDQNAQYDACAKRILGNKQILAHIIKAAIPGFQDMKPSEIIPYIEGEPLIGNVRHRRIDQSVYDGCDLRNKYGRYRAFRRKDLL